MREIDLLRQVILEMHGCVSMHVETVPIDQTCEGETVWQGLVEVFDLTNHPIANRCYAWTYQDDQEQTQYAVVLAQPWIQSAHDAVKAAIADPHLTRERTISFLWNLRRAGYGGFSGDDPEDRFCPNCGANVGPGTISVIGCPCCGYGTGMDDDDDDYEDEEEE